MSDISNLLLNKAYYHTLIGFLKASKYERAELSAICNLFLGVELKLNAIIGNKHFVPLSKMVEGEELTTIIRRLVGLDEELIKTFTKFVADFRKSRNEAVHYGLLKPMFLDSRFLNSLAEFIVYDISRRVVPDVKAILSYLCRSGKRFYDSNPSSNIPYYFYEKGLLIKLDEFPRVDATRLEALCNGTLKIFLDKRGGLVTAEKGVIINPLLALSCKGTRSRINDIARFIDFYFNRVSRAFLAREILSSPDVKGLEDYFSGIVEIVKKFKAEFNSKRAAICDLILMGIAKESVRLLNIFRNSIMHSLKVPYWEMTEWRESVRMAIEAMTKILDIHTTQARKLYREFFGVHRKILVRPLSFTRTGELHDFLRDVKEVFPEHYAKFRKAVSDSIVYHVSLLNWNN